MKKREGFVSNSSSASFIISFRSIKNIKDVIKDINASKKWYDNMGYPCENNLIEKDGIYLLSTSTTMFNDWYDIAAWPFIRMLDEKADSDYEIIRINQIEEEWSDCDLTVRFNPITWEIDDIIFYDKRGEPVNEKSKNIALKNQGAYEFFYEEYLEYLKDNTKSLPIVELSSGYFQDNYGGYLP